MYWFFIVLASLLVTASITVVPLVVRKNTFLWTLGGFTASLTVLLLVINLYTGGGWFFIAVIPMLFGLSIIFMPFAVRQIPLPGLLGKSRGLLIMLWDTLWLYAVITVCGLYANTPGYWPVALPITSFCLLLPWIIFLIFRYLKADIVTRTGLVVCVTGIFSSVVDDFIRWVLEGRWRLSLLHADFSSWNTSTEINSNVYLIVLLSFLLAGIILVAVGTGRQRKKRRG